MNTHTRLSSAEDDPANDHLRAATQVLQSPELLHQIFVCLAERSPQSWERPPVGAWYRRPDICDLFLFQRVNHFWRSTIQQSTQLKTAMWLTPDSSITLPGSPATLETIGPTLFTNIEPFPKSRVHQFTIWDSYMIAGLHLDSPGIPSQPGAVTWSGVSSTAMSLIRTSHFSLFNPIARFCKLRISDGTRYHIAGFSFGLGCNPSHPGTLGWHVTLVRRDKLICQASIRDGELICAQTPEEPLESWRDVLLAQPGGAGYHIDVYDSELWDEGRSCLGVHNFGPNCTLGKVAWFVRSCHELCGRRKREPQWEKEWQLEKLLPPLEEHQAWVGDGARRIFHPLRHWEKVNSGNAFEPWD